MNRPDLILKLSQIATTHNIETGIVELHVDDLRYAIDELSLLNIEHPPLTKKFFVRQSYGQVVIDHRDVGTVQEAHEMATHIIKVYEKSTATIFEHMLSEPKKITSYKGEKAV